MGWQREMYLPLSLGRWLPVICRQPNGTENVALTFDDGPHPHTTPKILRLLGLYNWKATFFVSGIRAAEHRDLLAEIVNAGHAVYGHAWDHIDLERASSPEILTAMRRVEDLLKRFRATPSPYLVRLPYNAGLKRVRFHAIARQFHPDARFAWWSITTRDWELTRDTACLGELSKRCSRLARAIEHSPALPGAIMLLHEAPFGVEGELAPLIAEVLLPEILQAIARRKLTAGLIELTPPRKWESVIWWHPSGDRSVAA